MNMIHLLASLEAMQGGAKHSEATELIEEFAVRGIVLASER